MVRRTFALDAGAASTSKEMLGDLFDVGVVNIEAAQGVSQRQYVIGIGAAWTSAATNPGGYFDFGKGAEKMRIAVTGDIHDCFGENIPFVRIVYGQKMTLETSLFSNIEFCQDLSGMLGIDSIYAAAAPLLGRRDEGGYAPRGLGDAAMIGRTLPKTAHVAREKCSTPFYEDERGAEDE